MKQILRLVTAALLLSNVTFCLAATLPQDAPVQHVLLISVDGLHADDLSRFIDAHPDSTLSSLAKDGIEYGNTHTVEPADSFPGLLALVTGGTPAVTGVYYDDSYDRRLAAPGSDCSQAGTRVLYDESLDRRAADGRDTIDPAKLPRDPQHGCAPVYPHTFLRVNTIFEAIRAAGGYTAWTDKHPTYELVEGPSGHGVDDLFLPEIGANHEGQHENPREAQTPGITGSLARTENYDDLKARAIVNEIDGMSHDGHRRTAVPNVFGLNMQAVNVAQKLYGYRDADGHLAPGVDQAIGHVDTVLARFMTELDRKGLREDTLVIVTAKHGNGPIDPARLDKIDDRRLRAVIDAAAPGALAQLTTDHGALVWLHDASSTAAVTAALHEHAGELGILDVIGGVRLAQRFPSPTQDNRTPDLVIVSRDGVIFTAPDDAKLAEHGGFHEDDTRVALLLSNPRLANRGLRVSYPVSTTQVAPTILAALGVSPGALAAVVQEGTPVLPAMRWTGVQDSSWGLSSSSASSADSASPPMETPSVTPPVTRSATPPGPLAHEQSGMHSLGN